jgi:hypothetical protein
MPILVLSNLLVVEDQTGHVLGTIPHVFEVDVVSQLVSGDPSVLRLKVHQALVF